MKFYDMKCPYCEGTDQQAENPYCDDFKPSVYRRINCENCGKHYVVEYILQRVYDEKDHPIWNNMMMVEKDLDTIYLLCASERDDVATDIVFDKIDRMLCDGKFNEVDAVLKAVNVLGLSTAVMRSFLTITKPASEKLPTRSLLYNKIYARMVELRGKEKADRILKNLE